jgi:ABC-2 type transport system ATP-binding protein
MLMANPIIQVENLVKSYGDVQAVRGVSFSVDEGEVFGLLGPNGAGKTSTVEILEGLRDLDGGRARSATRFESVETRNRRRSAIYFSSR